MGVFNVSEVVAWAEAYDGAQSAHGAAGAGRLIDVNTGGPANSLGLGEANDVHSYPYPAAPRDSGTQFAMVGEFGGLGWFPAASSSWAPGDCYTYLQMQSPQAFADLYCVLTESLTLEGAFVSGAIVTQATDLECECDGA